MHMLVEAFLRSPLTPQMIEDAIKTAKREGRIEHANGYRYIGDQVANTPR
jgi:hypothetical protein